MYRKVLNFPEKFRGKNKNLTSLEFSEFLLEKWKNFQPRIIQTSLKIKVFTALHPEIFANFYIGTCLFLRCRKNRGAYRDQDRCESRKLKHTFLIRLFWFHFLVRFIWTVHIQICLWDGIFHFWARAKSPRGWRSRISLKIPNKNHRIFYIWDYSWRLGFFNLGIFIPGLWDLF